MAKEQRFLGLNGQASRYSGGLRVALVHAVYYTGSTFSNYVSIFGSMMSRLAVIARLWALRCGYDLL